MNDIPDYVVLRPAPDAPEGFMPEKYNGLWLNRNEMEPAYRKRHVDSAKEHGLISTATATPTGRFETRPDGAVAEVWEFRP